MTRLRRSQAGPTYDAACKARPLFGHARQALPLWLWQLFVGSYVVFRPGYWSADHGIAFGRVLATTIHPDTSPALEWPGFVADVWFPADPVELGRRLLGHEGLRNGGVLRYVSEQEALTLRVLLPTWLDGPEPQPLSSDVLRVVLWGVS